MEKERALLKRAMDMLQAHFGENCEIVLHDMRDGYEHSIVDIRNGHITGRKTGDCTTNLGLEIAKGTKASGDYYNYITYSNNGKILRSSSMHFYDDQGELIGAFCINLDITDTVRMERFMQSYNKYTIPTEQPSGTKEFFTNDVQQLLDELIVQATVLYNKPPKLLSKEEKMEVMSYLDAKGAFVISKSGERICKLLGISKYTFYNYLDLIRKGMKDNG